MANANGLSRWWGIILCLGLLVLWATRPIGVAPPTHLDTPFDTTRALARLAVVLGDQRPHPTDSAANDAVEARLLDQIRKLGFTPQVHSMFHCNAARRGAAICARPRNILFWVTPPGRDAVMLTAHYDSVPAGPGASDDGMGVATALEVAHLLKGRRFARPVLVLITDAEEAGLVGAAAFAARDPLARQVGAVVNLEARGTTGIANMFQTGRPNGREVAMLRQSSPVPSANSLATSLYDILPNDTDLTMLLPLGVDAANYAVIGGGKRYHTPLDNLAHLDPASLRQMGASALAATQGFAQARAPGAEAGAEGNWVFTDMARQAFLALPAGLAAWGLALGFVAAVVLQVRLPGEGPIRTALAPLLALLAGTGLAVFAAVLVMAIRADDAYGTAWPVAMRIVYGAAGLLGASLIIRLLQIGQGARLAAAAWMWLVLLIGAAFAIAPGLATLEIWAVVPLVLAAIASFVPRLRRSISWLLALAALLFGLVALPVAGGLEDGLFVEYAAPGALLMVFLFLFGMPGAGSGAGEGGSSRHVPALSAGVLVIALGAALLVPAYGVDAPRHLPIAHEDDDGEGAFIIPGNGPVPAGMQALASFGTEHDEQGNVRARAPTLSDDGDVTVRMSLLPSGRRLVRLHLQSRWADRQELLIREGESIAGVAVDGTVPRLRGVPAYVGCTGRTCRTLDVLLLLAPGKAVPDIRWSRTRYGASPAAAALVAARPSTAQPVHVGDRQTLIRTIDLPGA